ncbi:MAG: ABC transporter substrate-binding protein [Acetobacteraceae bacterium]
MLIPRRTALGSAASAAILGAGPGRAQVPTIRIGVLTDLSGPYADIAGPTSVACVRQAVEDFGVAGKGFNVEVISGDHQNKADVGSNLARQWFDQGGVDMITDVPNSSVALAVAQVAKQKNKAYVNSSMGVEFTASEQCNANTIQWTYDVYMVSKLTGGALVKAGGDSWFFITADYAFGQALEQTATSFITQNGGKVVGRVAYPFPGTTDYSSFLIQAQTSGARVLGLANAGGDAVNTIKQAYEFGLPKGGMRLAAMVMFISDVHALGLEVAQGLTLSNSYYWDLNERTRAFNQRVRSKTPNNWPGMLHAGCYAGSLHYLKAVADMGIAAAKADGAAAIARMKAMPTDDDCFGVGSIRPDGRKLHPGYLFEVKKPSESKGPWDYYRLLASTPAAEAFRPLGEGNCALARG